MMAVVLVSLAFDDDENAQQYIDHLAYSGTVDPAVGHKGYLGRSVKLIRVEAVRPQETG
jgi:hypothetical protein